MSGRSGLSADWPLPVTHGLRYPCGKEICRLGLGQEVVVRLTMWYTNSRYTCSNYLDRGFFATNGSGQGDDFVSELSCGMPVSCGQDHLDSSLWLVSCTGCAETVMERG